MQKAVEKCLGLGIHLAPIHVCDDVTDMRNIYVIDLPDMRDVVVFGDDFIVDCRDEKFSPRFPANVFHDVALPNNVLNQPMNRNEISCWIVVVITIDIDVMGSCSSDKRKFDKYSNCRTNNVSVHIQMQSCRLS